MYFVLLKVHVIFVALSFVSFLLRTWWGFKDSEMLQSKGAFLAHKVITLTMLISALIMCFTVGQYPFSDSWLTEKLLLLVVYVIFAMQAFKPEISPKARSVFASITCLLFVMMYYIAKVHTPILLS